jgi:thiol:disulfide interchange protein DsbA
MRNTLLSLAALSILAAGQVIAQPYEEGRDYQRIGSPVSMPDDKVVVTDAFGYPCPACRSFLPYLDNWEENAPAYVEVEHLPVALQPGWDLFAQAYYTADVMGIAAESHEAMFRAIHDERRQFRSFDDLAQFYAQFGVEPESFVNTSQSFAVDAQMRRNRNDVRTYGVRSTPTVIVQGKWRVSPSGFDSYEAMLDVVDHLVEKEAAALGLSSEAETADTAEASEAAGDAGTG